VISFLHNAFRRGGRDSAALLAPRWGNGPQGGASALEAARVTVLTASLVVREPNDNGARVFVMCPGLGGSFLYDREEARKRIDSHFPELSLADRIRVSKLLHTRFLQSLAPPASAKPRGYVNRWRD
jgi:hypothetical protein